MRQLLGSAALLTMCVIGSAGAQRKQAPKQAGTTRAAAAISWTELMGKWSGESRRMPSDSVISAVTFTFGENKQVWVRRGNLSAEQAQVVTMAGDSVVFEYGPAASLVRPGHKVKVREVLHVSNHRGQGTFRATFDDGETLEGRTTVAHQMK